MKPDPIAMKASLQKRELQLQKIISQMKDDNLHTGTVYRNLEQELEYVKVELSLPTKSSRLIL